MEKTNIIKYNSEQRYWNMVLNNRSERDISVYYLNMNIYCNGNIFFNIGRILFFDDFNSIIINHIIN